MPLPPEPPEPGPESVAEALPLPPEPLPDESVVVTDVAGAVTGAADFVGMVVELVPDPPSLPEPPPLSPVDVAGPLVGAGLVVAGPAVVPDPPGPLEPDPLEPELGASDVLDAGAEVPTVLATVVDGTLAGAFADGAVLAPAEGGVV